MIICVSSKLPIICNNLSLLLIGSIVTAALHPACNFIIIGEVRINYGYCSFKVVNSWQGIFFNFCLIKAFYQLLSIEKIPHVHFQ